MAGTISRVEVWKCVFPLPERFQLGTIVLSERDYTIVRIETEDGVVGVAFGLSRGAPLDVVIAEMLAPNVLGKDASRSASLMGSWARTLVHHAPEGLVQRALSLLDVAVWDIKGKIAGQPVWSLLGGARPIAPVMLVEGYPVADEGDEQFAERIGERASSGYSAIKIANPGGDPRVLTRRLDLVREVTDDRVALTVDIDHGWADLTAGIAQARKWSHLGLAWIEDPVHAHDVEGLHRLREAIDIPLAAGDEVTNSQTLHALVDRGAVDVLRLDVTCGGGFTGFAPLYHHAVRGGTAISTHVYPELHRHVVFAYPECGPVEMFANGNRWDTSHLFVRPPDVRVDQDSGVAVLEAPTEPGLGLDVDWSAVKSHAVRHHVVTSESAGSAPE